MPLLVRDKAFYKSLLSIAVPITLQNLVNFSVGMVDTIMLGALGETALSASSLGNQPGFVFGIAVFGIANGAMVLNAQYWGKRELEPIRKIIGMVIRVSLLLGLLLTAAVFAFPTQVMRIFTPDAAVIREGARYLRVIAFTYLLVAYSNSLTISLRSIEVVKISVVVSTTSVVMNIILNYILIFGKFGAPALGIVGAAIATVIARFTECIIVTVYLLWIDKTLLLKWRHIFGTDKALKQDFLRFGAPVAVNEVLWSLGMAAQSMILGRLGSDAVSANAICSVTQQFVTVFVFGVANACGVVIGKTVGSGDFQLARRYARTMQICFIGLGVVCAATMFLLRDFVIGLYNVSEGTKLLTRQFLTVNTFIVFTVSYTAPCLMGIHRGGGDARFVLLLDLLLVWGITIPLGAVAGLYYGLSMPVVYLFLKIDEPLKMLLSSLRLRGTKWIRNVTRTELEEF